MVVEVAFFGAISRPDLRGGVMINITAGNALSGKIYNGRNLGFYRIKGRAF